VGDELFGLRLKRCTYFLCLHMIHMPHLDSIFSDSMKLGVVGVWHCQEDQNHFVFLSFPHPFIVWVFPFLAFFVFLFFVFLLCLRVFGLFLSLLCFLKLVSVMAEFAHCCQPVLCTEAQYGCLCLTFNSTHGQELMKSVGML
jgi:hypothetical protein